MNASDFLGQVLPPAGHYCLFHKAEGYPTHEWFPTIAALCAAVERHADTVDLYYGTAAYAEPTERTQPNVSGLKALRLDIDAGEKKHAKDPKNTYATQAEAVAAFGKAVTAGLPRPNFVISSGEGVHIYWVLAETAAPAEWTKTAAMLQLACMTLGLKVDTKVTKDTARVLRPVGALHNNGKRVGEALCKQMTTINHPIGELHAALQALVPEEDLFALSVESSKLQRNVNNDILEIKGPPASIVKVAEHCAVIGWVRDTRGVVPEPTWRGFLGVAKYCEDGEQYAHEWSKGDSRYDYGETQAKFDRWETPPATCASFEDSGKCDGCKYRGKVTTPKQLGHVEVKAEPLPAPPQTTATWTLPDDFEEPEMAELAEVEEADDGCPVPGRADLFDPTNDSKFFYQRSKRGHWTLYYREKKQDVDETGTKVEIEYVVPVINKLVWLDSVTDVGAGEAGGSLSIMCRIDRYGSKHINRSTFPGEISSSPAKIAEFMGSQSVYLDPTNPRAMAHLGTFVGHEHTKVQSKMQFVIKNRFGYQYDGDTMVCCQGDITVYPRGHEGGELRRVYTAPGIRAMAPAFDSPCLPPAQTGDAWPSTVWRDHVAPSAMQYIKFLRTHYGHEGFGVARLALAVPLASPVLVFCADAPFTTDAELPTCGLVVSMFSQASGRGKSAIQEVLAAAFGKPSLKRSGSKEAATTNALREMAHTTAIYPFILDEVTRNSAADAAALLDVFSNGQGRVRLDSSARLKGAASTWALITSVSTNVPQRELIAAAQKSSNALSNRLLELDFDTLAPTGSHVEFTEDFKKLLPHYGAFGLLLAYMVVNKGPDAMMAMGQAKVAEAYAYLDCPQEFRFFARGLAAVLVTSELLGRHFPFDIEEIKEQYRSAVQSAIAAGVVAKNDLSSEVANMLASLAPNIAVTDNWTPCGNDMLLNQPRMPLFGREVQKLGVAIVDSTRVRAWCMENQTSCRAFLERARKAGILVCNEGEIRTKKVRLNTGLRSMPTQLMNTYAFRTRLKDTGESAE